MGFKVFHYTKGLNHAFTQSCNTMAQAAMLHSPSAMLGKNDTVMPWRNRACQYLAIERKVLAGSPNQSYQLSRYDNKDNFMLDSKSPLLDRDDRIIGLIGSCLEINSLSVFSKKPTLLQNGSLVVNVGGNEIHMSKRETIVLQWILRGKMTSEIGLLENRSTRTIEGHIANIKRKLQAQTKGDIIYIAHQLGLLHLTFESG